MGRYHVLYINVLVSVHTTTTTTGIYTESSWLEETCMVNKVNNLILWTLNVLKDKEASHISRFAFKGEVPPKPLLLSKHKVHQHHNIQIIITIMFVVT